MDESMIQRKLDNQELKAFFREMRVGWNWLSWSTQNTHFNHFDAMTIKPIYEDSLITPDDEQAYIIIDLTRPALNVKNDILYYFHLAEYEVFEKPTSTAYDNLYGMRFTFRPDIEKKILGILARTPIIST